MRALAILMVAFFSLSSRAEYLSLEPIKDPTRARNPVGPPALSFFLPGFDQFWEGQTDAAVTYSLVAATGIGLAASAIPSIDSSETDGSSLGDLSGPERQYTYGLQLYMFAGELSAYHSFRTAVETLKPYGLYTFLPRSERSSELMLAPFEFSQALRPTTFVPLLLLAALGPLGIDPNAYVEFDDMAFASGVSYNAGVGEEALFRGYFMPYLRQQFGSDFWSNSTQALVFGLAHLSEANRYPLAQTLMGYYLGWLTQRNQWSLRQSIFLHTWWDVIAIGIQIAHDNGQEKAAVPMPLFSGSF